MEERMSGREREEKLRKDYEEAGQAHVFRFVDSLSEEERERLYSQLEQIDVKDLNIKYARAAAGLQQKKQYMEKVEPLKEVTKLATASTTERERWTQLGYRKIKEGKVAALVLAGGQGTRLGSDQPKGTYEVGLPSGKSLFQLQAERLLKVQELAAHATGVETTTVMWYVMTSDATDLPTRDYFKNHNYFGLKKEHIFFFVQGTLPCLTPEGKIIMQSKEEVSSAPDGNGGLFHALERSGALADMKSRGVEYLFQYSVDNILIKMADPTFAGFLYEQNADCGCKVVAKTRENELVGVVCLHDGKYTVLEYSEIAPELSRLRNESTGELVFNAAHLCINTFRIDFLEKAASTYASLLTHHVAKRPVPAIDDKGASQTVNGWKLELFIFDVFGFAEKLVAFEVPREQEFSPLKNGAESLVDCPRTCRLHLSRLHKSFIQAAGGKIVQLQHKKKPKRRNGEEKEAAEEEEKEEDLIYTVEVSPLLSYAGEGLEATCQGKVYELKPGVPLLLSP
ncbi:UDP-N-acetylglucosamine pyrophosphorylase [Balamuthia mandrillaris]